MGPRQAMAALAGRPRTLPVAIACMGLLIVCKAWGLALGGTAPGVLASAGRAVVPAAHAAAEESHKPAPPPAPSLAPSAPAAGHGEPAASPASPVRSSPSPAAPAAALAPAPPPVSDAERTLLQDLRGRRAELDARDAAAQRREAVVAAAEKRLSARLDELTAMQARLEALDGARRERDEANWRGLVKTYETMRPRDAAAIFNDLDQPVLMQVLDRMKEAKAAAVLAAMQPDRARLATTDLAKWRARTTDPQP